MSSHLEDDGANVPSPIDPEDQRVLDLAQNTREELVKSLRDEKGSLPRDNETRNVLLTALDHMTKTALAKTKIKLEDKSVASNDAVRREMQELLIQLHNQDMVSGKGENPVLPSTIPEVKLVPGQTDIGVSTMNHAEFIEMHKED